MTSYFEIGGELISVLDDSNDIQYGLGMISAKEHREARAENKEVASGLRSLESSRYAPRSSEKDSLFTHWIKTGTYNIREFAELPGKRKISLLTNPRLLAAWGIPKQLEIIEMNYDYFVKGESREW